MSEKVFIVSAVAIILLMIGFMLPVIVKHVEQREKYDRCVVEHAKEVHEVNRYCTALVRKGEYDDL